MERLHYTRWGSSNELKLRVLPRANQPPYICHGILFSPTTLEWRRRWWCDEYRMLFEQIFRLQLWSCATTNHFIHTIKPISRRRCSVFLSPQKCPWESCSASSSYSRSPPLILGLLCYGWCNSLLFDNRRYTKCNCEKIVTFTDARRTFWIISPPLGVSVRLRRHFFSVQNVELRGRINEFYSDSELWLIV